MFRAKKIESLTLGKILKETRISSGLSLEKCSQVLKIQKKYLERLEQGFYEKLPADVYTKSFIKKYARLLDLDVDKMLQYYSQERKIAQHLRNQKAISGSLKSPRFVITPRIITLFILLFFFLFTAGYLFYQFKKLIGRPAIFLEYPLENSVTSSEKVEFKGKTDPSIYLTINGQPVNLERDGSFKEMVSLQANLNTIRLEAVNQFNKKTIKVRQIIKE